MKIGDSGINMTPLTPNSTRLNLSYTLKRLSPAGIEQSTISVDCRSDRGGHETHFAREHTSRAVLDQLHPFPVKHLAGVTHASSGHGDQLFLRFLRLLSVALLFRRDRSTSGSSR